jgi:hypothetical protein
VPRAMSSAAQSHVAEGRRTFAGKPPAPTERAG